MTTPKASSLTYREYLALAIPFIISTVTQPLLGAVDTAVLGRLDDASFMGGVAIGTVIFNTMYWLFGFLRVSTSGFSAQSLGSGKEEDTYYAYFRPFIMAVIISMVFLLLQVPIREVALMIYKPTRDIRDSAMTYFNILILGAPFVLIGYVNLGWLMGRKLVKETLMLQVTTNVVNIVLDLVMVVHFKMGVAGVAYATLISQAIGFLIGLALIGRRLPLAKIGRYRSELFKRKAFRKIVSVNSDLFIRTVCLLTVTNIFVAGGSAQGKNILAANAVLFQIQYIMAYFYDGIANASSVFGGKAYGAGDEEGLREVFTKSNVTTIVLSLMTAFMMVVLRLPALKLFTDIPEVILAAEEYSWWMVVFPLVIGPGLVYYGIMTGISITVPVRNSMILSLLVFLVTYQIALPLWGNHGLWLAFILYSFGRSFFLIMFRGQIWQGIRQVNSYS